jgi:2'-5' RNA ligase
VHRPGGEARGDSDNRWRLFVAIFPSREAQAAAARATEALRSPGDGVAWVKPGNLHYTLRFLGDLGPDGATRAAEAAREAAADHEPFGAALGAFGVFPSARRARVLWVGLTEGDEQMRLLAASLEASLVRHGFGEADKPFEPHLTVGRLRVPGDWMAKLVAARAVEARFTVDQVVLIRSVLSPGGSLYKVVGEAWLGAGGE